MSVATAKQANPGEILAAREQYAGRGWKTVPLTNGKSPIGVPNWQSRQFTPDDFKRTWQSPRVRSAVADKGSTFAEGVGVQLGPTSNLVDIEWDTPAQHARAVELCGGSLPDGPEFKSRQGGHKLFARDARLAELHAAIAEFPCDDGTALKIRVGEGGKGAQSAFPPSPGKEWLPGKSPDALPLPAMPEPLVAAILAASKPARPIAESVWSERQFADSQIAACRDALAELPDAVSGENGQSRFMSACRVIRQHVGNYEQALELATWFNDTKCLPPFDAPEVERKLNQSDEPPRQHPDDIFDELPFGEVASIYKPFPTHVLPEPLRNFVSTVALSIGCDDSYIALPLLTQIAGAIGNSRVLELKPGWTAPAILWTATVGESGTAKSPAARAATKAIREIERAANGRNAERLQRFEEESDCHAKLKANWKAADGPGGPPKKPTPPASERYVVSDTTVEALAIILQSNPRGLLLIRDELVLQR
jgi:hypothetical protein